MIRRILLVEFAKCRKLNNMLNTSHLSVAVLMAANRRIQRRLEGYRMLAPLCTEYG